LHRAAVLAFAAAGADHNLKRFARKHI
jgi:hypothetical protein